MGFWNDGKSLIDEQSAPDLLALCYWNLFHAFGSVGSLPDYHAAERLQMCSWGSLSDELQPRMDVADAEVEPCARYAAQLLCELKTQSGLDEKDAKLQLSANVGKVVHDRSEEDTAFSSQMKGTRKKNNWCPDPKDIKNHLFSYRISRYINGSADEASPLIEVADDLHSLVSEHDPEEIDFPLRFNNYGLNSSAINGTMPQTAVSKNTTRRLKKREHGLLLPTASFGASNVTLTSSKRPRKYKTLAELYT